MKIEKVLKYVLIGMFAFATLRVAIRHAGYDPNFISPAKVWCHMRQWFEVEC